jgi:hypothetical protein
LLLVLRFFSPGSKKTSKYIKWFWRTTVWNHSLCKMVFAWFIIAKI